MKYLAFNTVVLAALGYLFVSDGRLNLPWFKDEVAVPTETALLKTSPQPTLAQAETVQATERPEPESPTLARDQDIFSPPPVTTPVATPAQTPAPLPEIGEAEPVATLPETRIAAAETVPVTASSAPPSTAPAVQLATGEALMSRTERTRELDRLIEDMELFYVERLAR